MKILWIGEHTNQTIMNRLVEHGYCPQSITVAQGNLTEGLKKISPIDSISGCRLPFLWTKSLRFKGEAWEEDDGSSHYFVDLITLPYVELLYKTRQMIKTADRWAKKNCNEKCCVIIYGLHTPYLKCIQPLKKHNHNLTITCIVPDLPEYYDFHPSSLKKVLKKLDLKIIYNKIKECDKFVLFTENMQKRLAIKTGQYIIMEGCIRQSDISKALCPKTREDGNAEKILLYTGSLNNGYGIEELLEAFSFIRKPEYELMIIGSGSMVPQIEEAARHDKRIRYLGYMADQDKLHEYQRNATVLLCMIPPDNIATKYCFPSKLFEYMVSGNPTMAYRLEGVGHEYYDYIIPFGDETPQGMAISIQQVVELSEEERNYIGLRSRQFIAENKNNFTQAKRIFEYATVNDSRG